MKLRADELAELSGGRLIYGSRDNTALDIKTDSREAGSGDLFLPVVGERTDGHLYLSDVVKSGASIVFTARHRDMKELKADEKLYGALLKRGEAISVISVSDTIKAIQKAASNYRHKRLSELPVVGVTGSVGKTTTREMTACALSAEKRVFATKGNKNSQIGVPMTVLDIADEELAVLELGISKPGEMKKIAAIASPDVAVMTNIGSSHIEYLGSRKNILKEKLRIVTGSKKPVKLVLNGDDELLSKVTGERLPELSIDKECVGDIIYCGFSEDCDVRGIELELRDGRPEFTVAFYKRDKSGVLSKEPYKSFGLSLSTLGEHTALDALLALGACEACGVDIEKACRALSGFKSLKGRGEIFEKDGIKVINDAYNASPDSMRAALSVLDSISEADRRIAVLADMRELGKDEAKLHEEIGDFINEEIMYLDGLYLYGELARHIGERVEGDIKKRYFDDLESLYGFIKEEQRPGDVILYKGSNSMGLSGLIERLYGEG